MTEQRIRGSKDLLTQFVLVDSVRRRMQAEHKADKKDIKYLAIV